jgi:hypothetical protein
MVLIEYKGVMIMTNYWVLKPERDVKDDRTQLINYWDKFVDERENRGKKVIAIGWSLGPESSSNSLERLRNYMIPL